MAKHSTYINVCFLKRDCPLTANEVHHYSLILKVPNQLCLSLLWKSKNLFSAFRTPAVLFVLVCFLYVLSGLLIFIGLSTFALVCDWTMGVVMMSMLIWAFIRYSGRYRNVGGAIDQAAGVVLEQVGVVGLVALVYCLYLWVFFSSLSHSWSYIQSPETVTDHYILYIYIKWIYSGL